jgi:hypothetical protein
MHKHASFAIMAAVLLTAIVTITLYTVNRANAQGNETSAAAGGQEHNMTNAAGGQEHNMTNAAGAEPEFAAVGTCVKVGNQETC